MIHKILGRLASARSFVFAALALAGFTSFATDYIDATGNPASATCAQISSSTTTLETGWYVVEGTVSISSTVTVNGDVNLILADGAKLTVSVSESYKAGILVANDGTTVNTLTIWCQSGGTGELVVSGGFFAAGIGGDYATTDCGAVTIYGGSITATGNYGAGIGGGTGGAGGDVAINGGTVVARDGSSGDAAGIGRGAFSSKSQGTLTVSDKIEVLAGSSESTASLLTRNSDTGAVTISGQKWFFAGPQSLHQGTTSFTAYSGTVGSAINVDLSDTIKGGTGVYTFGLKDGSSLPEWLVLSGTTLSGTPTGAGSSTFTFVVEDTSEPKLSLEATYTVVVKDRYSITYKDGESTLSLYPTTYINGTGISTLPTPTKASHEFQGWFTNSLFTGTQFTSISTTDSGDYTFYSKWLQLTTGDVLVTFAGEGSAPITKTCTIVESSMTTLSDTGSTEGWYVVYNNVSFSSSVTISGNVKLVLMDGKTMTVEIPNGSSISKAAITVTPGNLLTIYGQANGSGRIEATATSISAGIGGGWSQDCGSVTINGGTVIAKSTSGGPGIGGGYQKAGGTVTINGGTVIATGASSTYPGIGGGGSSYEQGKLYVGANVVVKAGSSSTLTDANIQPHVDGQIDLTTCYQYYSAETVGPAPLVQINSAFSAYIGEAFELSLPGTVSGGTDPCSFTLKTPASLPSWLSRTGDTLSGTPAAVGDSCEITYTVADSGSPAQNAEFTYTITVTALPKPITYMNGTVEITGLTPSNYVEGVGATLPTTAPAASGYELEGWYLTPACDGEKVTAISAEATGPQTFYANWVPIEYTITYKDSETLTDIPASALPANAPTTYTIEAATTLPATATKAGKGFYGWYLTSACTGDAVTAIAAGQTGPKTFYAKWGVAKSNETYIDASGHEQVVECTEIGSDTTSLATGWYVVKGNVSTYSKVTVSGNVNLILADDAVYTVSVSSYGEAIMIKGDNSLTIYGGVAGTGALNVSASSGPAIGANNDTSSHFGTLTVYGGNVTANGSYCGIGGGYNTPGGDVYVYGGTVIANGGGSSAAGIGGYGSSKTTGTLTVAENVVVMTKTSDYGASYVMKPHGENGAITLEGEQYYKLITPRTATVPYRDTDGVVKNATCTLVTADINSFDGGWYAVTGNLDFGSAGIFISGDVKLIVADGASLTVAGRSSSPYSAGISVPVGASLTVYGQAEGTGAITATGGSFSAGIGGGYQQSAGTITINGGNLTAIGNTQWSGGAGIGGGGNKGNGGTVVINGGRVEATGNAGSGIGKGGSGTSDGTLTVDASMVVMAGASSSATEVLVRDETTGAITLGGQAYFLVTRAGATPLTQTGSALEAYKGEAVELSFADTVSGGTKPYSFAYKSGTLPAGISSATLSGTPTEAGTFVFVVTVSDGAETPQSEDFTYTLTVSVRPKAITYKNGETTLTGLEPTQYTPGIAANLPATATAPTGYAFAGWYDNPGLTGDAVTAVSSEETDDQTFWAKFTPNVYAVTYMDGATAITDQNLAPTNYTIESATLDLPASATKAGKEFYGWYDNADCLGDAVTTIPAGSSGEKVFYAKWGPVRSDETYVDAGGNTMPQQRCAQITSDVTALDAGWYIVKGQVSIDQTVTVSGDVKLILADDAVLTVVVGQGNSAGISIPAGSSLEIFAQTAAGTGSLSATAGGLSAGIGGNYNGTCGTVVINGGSITAQGGSNGAGIGGGNSTAGGAVTINGGMVTATAGSFGAGIGGGYQGSGGTVTVNGGVVVANGGSNAAGIGAGWSGASQGTLTVATGLAVKAGASEHPETVIGEDGAVTLGGEQYYVVEKAGLTQLRQIESSYEIYVGEPFEMALTNTVRGGSGSYSFTLKDGSSLPAWLTRSGDTLSGTPTAGSASSFTFTVEDTVEATVADLDCTYTITASIRPTPITYMDGAEEMTGLTPSNYIEGVGVELPEIASKTGYLHLGWYTAAIGGERVYSVSAEATGPQIFYAHWTTAPYTITYKDGNTTLTGLAPTYYDIETATFNLPEPLAPEGKAFVGWFTDPDFNTQATSIPAGSTGNKTFYVKWRDAEAGEGEDVVTFIDANGSERTENCKVLTSAMTTLETGWYVVNNDLTVNSSVTIDGNVNIVLVDGKTLTVNANNAWATAGIAVAAGSSLSIYGQAEGTGSLNATGGDYGAGIGSGYNKNAGNVTINGGTVTATGHDGSGIGAGSGGDGGTVVINRGTVTATGGGSGAGIGGDSGNICNVTINGGSVEARGAMMASGIGGGFNNAGGTVTITGGDVLAVGGNMAAGIGGGYMGAGGTVNITGGSVTATGGDANSSGIGGGNGSSSHGELTVGAGLSCRAGAGENPSQELDPVVPGAGRYYVIDDGSTPIGPTVYEIKYYDHYDEIRGLYPSNYVEGVGATLAIPVKAGYDFVGWYLNSNCEGESVTAISADATGVQSFYAKWEKTLARAVVDYLDIDGETKSVECAIVDAARKDMTNGWYAVTNVVAFTKGMTATNDVKLILADGAALTVSNSRIGEAGVNVPAGSSLTIYGQSEGTGTLTATGYESGAGIGGNSQRDGGAITINGGSVTATGGAHGAAGIGGGYSGSCGAVTINGGTVTARGGNNGTFAGAGIGGGNDGNGGDVVLNGGTVTAIGGGTVAGIGAGKLGTDRGTLKAGEDVNVWAGANADSAEELTQKREDGTFWIFGTYNYYYAETATAESEFSITYKENFNNIETVFDLAPATYQSGTGLSELPVPEKTGYTFLGWYTSQWFFPDELVTEIEPGSTGDKTLWAKWTPTVYTVTYHDRGNAVAELVPASYAITNATLSLPGYTVERPYFTFVGWCDNAECTGSTVATIPAGSTGNKEFYAKWVENAALMTSVTFVGVEGSQTESCRVLTTDVTALETGWYVVNADLDYGAQGLTVSGDVKLVLADGASLTATAASQSQKAGINVPEGASLTIYAQSEGTGELTVAGDPENIGYAAGIGGNANESCGTVTIYGGIVTASSNDGGAGIGGGYKGQGGTVVINGGFVTATSGGYGAGIGGGKGTVDNGGHGGSVTINGGTIVATADAMAAGIGGGYYGDGGTVTINGGVVTATGGPGESGIGKGAGAENQVVLTVGGGISVFVGDNANPSIDILEVDEHGVATMPSRPKRYYIVSADSGDPAFEIVDGVLVGVNIKGNADIVIPDGVLDIGQRVFEEETALASVVIPNSVTNIGYSAFEGCTSLTNVTFGTGLKAIGSHAFNGCTELEEVTIPGNVEHVCEGAFYGCSGLVSLTIEEGVKTIDTYAFYGCSVLTGDPVDGLYFPDGLEEIGASAFISCPQLAKVSLPGSMYEPGAPMSQAFGSDTEVVYRTTDPVFYILGDTLYSVDTKGNASVTIPGTVKKIGTASFRNIPTLERVTVPASVTNIASLAFYACSNLVEVAIGDGVESIDSDAFAECTSLTDVTIPDSVAVIGRRAFKDCTALESATVLAGDIGDDAFNGCMNLATVVLGDGVTGIGDSAFRGCIPLTSLAVPGNVAAIGSSAFWGCSNLVEVVISNGVSKTIGDWAFSSCESLATLSLGEGVASIGERAFMNCRALATLAMPDSVETVGASAFSGCSGLAALTFGSGLKTVGSEAFDGCSSLENGVDGLYFPDGLESIGADAFRMCNKLTKVSLPSSQYANGTIHPAFDYWQVTVDYRGVAPVFYVDADGFMRSVNLKGATEITIPSTVHDMQIGAFAESDTLTSVVIPSSVTNIAMGAFRACPNLGRVTISEGVKTIGESAFMGCASLAELTIPNGVTVIGDMAFWRCTALESITVPKGVDIGMFAFYGCSSMTSVNIAGEATRMRLSSRMLLRATSSNPDATSVGGFAFYECSNLTSATIGSAVDEIGGGAFGACPKLTTVTLQNNDNFTTDNGMLLTKDGATLVSVYGSNTSVTVPEGVAAIKEGACAGGGMLQSVVLPSGVTTIGEAAFSNATAFATITIPQTVTTIGVNAFYGTVLATVNVAKCDAARVKALVEGTGYAGAVAYIEPGDEPTEWPEDTSTVASQTAAEAFGITEGPLTNVNAKALADWAKDYAKGNVSYAEIGSIIPDAFLLNCANTAAAVEAAEAVAEEAIKITAITFDSEGNPVLTCPEAYGNGQVVIKGSVDIGASASWHNKTAGDRFFKTVLELK